MATATPTREVRANRFRLPPNVLALIRREVYNFLAYRTTQ